MTEDIVLQVKNLQTYFYTEEGIVPAVDGLDFSLRQGETLAIVGESGCGKSVTSMSVLRLVPTPPGKILGGEILYKGEDLLKKSEKQMRSIRGNEISMIFQEPLTSLNPVFTIGRQITDILRLHQSMNKKQAREKALEMLRKVRIPAPEKVIDDYPHQLSGGMRQRIMIAMVLSVKPELIIADEPTTALDVTIQAQIMELMGKLKEEMGTSIILITHDMGVIADIADDVMVMYGGNVVEQAPVADIFEHPLHPYTQGLLASIPRMDMDVETLAAIEGTVPSLAEMPTGCHFSTRCPYCTEKCRSENPAMVDQGGHKVACWKYE